MIKARRFAEPARPGIRLAIVLVLGLLPPLAAAGPAMTQANTPTGNERVRVPSTRVWLTPPEGFTPAATFTGFQHVESGSSLMVNLIPGPYEELIGGLRNRRRLAQQGMDLLSKKKHAAGEHPGMLLRVGQRVQGRDFEKLMWVFGSDEETVVIMGIFPVDLADRYREVLETAVLSGSWDPNAEISPLEGIGFSLGDTGSLELLARMANMLTYTEGGETDPDGVGRPMFLIGPAFGSADTSDRRGFAQRRLRETAHHGEFAITSERAAIVDGLDGHEIVATALSDTGVETTIYQLLLFDAASFWVAQGIVRSSQADVYLPMFRRMAASFQRDRNVIESGNGLLRLTLPTGWTQLDIQDEADLQVGNATAECYLIVLTEPKADFEETVTLAEFSDMTRSGMKEGLEMAQEIGPRHLLLDGRDAIQFELHADVDGAPIVYLHTCVEGEQHFHQVLAWTLGSAFTDNRNALDVVIESFEEKR